MKTWICIFLLGSALFVAVDGEKHGLIPDRYIKASIAEIKNGAKAVYRDAKDLALETKENFRESLQDELDDITSDVTKIKEDIQKASGKEKKALEEKLAKLEAEEKELRQKLEKLHYTDKSFWGKIKSRYRQTSNSIKKTYDHLITLLKRD